MVFSRRSRESSGGGGGSSSSRTRDTAESGTPRGDGFAAFMRSQSGRIGAAADPADTRRQLSAEWLQLTVSERREWRRRDASHHARSEADRQSLGSPGSARAAGSTPPRASRRKSPSTRSRSKHVRCPPVTHRAPVHNHDAPHRGLRLARACVPAPASSRRPSWQPFSTHRSCSPACTAYTHVLNTTVRFRIL